MSTLNRVPSGIVATVTRHTSTSPPVGPTACPCPCPTIVYVSAIGLSYGAVHPMSPLARTGDLVRRVVVKLAREAVPRLENVVCFAPERRRAFQRRDHVRE